MQKSLGCGTKRNKMMKTLAFVSAFCIVSVFSGELYTDEFKDFDQDAYFKDEVKSTAFFNCVKGAGECDVFATAFKEHFADAVPDACAKCNPLHKKLGSRILEELHNREPELLKAIFKTADPEGKYYPNVKKNLNLSFDL